MSNQYHLLSELVSIISISLNNAVSTSLNFFQNQTQDDIDYTQVIQISDNILDKMKSKIRYDNLKNLILFSNDFYNTYAEKRIKYILDLRSDEHHHFLNMDDICPTRDYWSNPRKLQADRVRYKMGEYIGDNLLDHENFNSNILITGECSGDVYYLKLGLTTEGLAQLIILEKLSGGNKDFLDILKFLYYNCEEQKVP